MRIIALETSCDETACAIVDDGRRVLSNVIHTQIDLHARFGGVIPEAAAREHLQSVNPVIQQALDDAGLENFDTIDAFAATLGPGLVGSLLSGVSAAKTLAFMEGKPFIGVHHLFGHVASNYLESDLEPPFLCLLVSGGHTQLVHVKTYADMEIVGTTVDDAVGEAYDKISRLIGLGYPGGPAMDKAAQAGNPKAFDLPTPRLKEPFNFSFSGLKTACVRQFETALATKPSENIEAARKTLAADMAASFQHRVVEILYKTTFRCAASLNLHTIALAGGVSANSGLRNRFEQLGHAGTGWRVFFPNRVFCTDNAAMIASAAYFSPLTHNPLDEVFSRVYQPAVSPIVS